jgi:2-keto-3-deoxy-L-rhamnonate aldolase RhmA
MTAKQVFLTSALCAVTCLLVLPAAKAQNGSSKMRMYNTVKQKLKEGKQVVGGTIYTDDPNIYCAMAEAGFDFLWIEMQHSPLMYDDVAKMIWACKDAPAIPFIRIPNATEGDIQKAVDIGALGIVVPMVHTVEEAQDAVKYAKYPPIGRRSRGGGQYDEIWGGDYRETANENVMIVVMIESPEGVAMVDKIAAVPGIDVVFAASGDIGSFTGWERTDPRYMKLIKRVHDETLKAGKILGGPFSWSDRPDFMFLQGPSETSLIETGAEVELTGAAAGKNEDVATGDR